MDKRRNSDLILLAYRLQEIQKTGGKTTIRHDDDSGKHDFIKYTPDTWFTISRCTEHAGICWLEGRRH